MIYKLHSSGSGDGNVSLDVREDDVIEGIGLDISMAGPSDGAAVDVEVAFGSSSSFSTNDTSGTMIGSRIDYDVITSGAAQAGKWAFMPMKVKINAGERLYMHIDVTGSLTYWARAYIHTSKGGGASRIVRR
jgi:hypothetical protein